MMNLKDTINNTNRQKENLKTGVNKINSKLIEIGGEQAFNLFDVPDKMQKIIENYAKIATVSTNVMLQEARDAETKINYSLDFHPDFAFIFFRLVNTNFNLDFEFDTRRINCLIQESYNENACYFKITKLTQTELVLKNVDSNRRAFRIERITFLQGAQPK